MGDHANESYIIQRWSGWRVTVALASHWTGGRYSTRLASPSTRSHTEATMPTLRRIASLVVMFLVVGFLVPAVAGAQATVITPPGADSVARPTANPADVASADAILNALYDVISGPAGQLRDWNRFRSLMVPNARLMPTRVRADGSAGVVVWSADDYVKTAGAGLERNGFFEREIHRTSEAYGSILHAFSTYESRRTADLSESPFARGINSIQLLKDADRWWVVSIFWDSERPGNDIPKRYLPK